MQSTPTHICVMFIHTKLKQCCQGPTSFSMLKVYLPPPLSKMLLICDMRYVVQSNMHIYIFDVIRQSAIDNMNVVGKAMNT